MANIKQQIADTYEYSKLISETLISEVEQLEQLDANTNNLGKTALKLAKLTEDIATDVNNNKDKLSQTIETQGSINENLASVGVQLETLKKSVDESTASLDTVADAVIMVSEAQETNKAEIVDTIGKQNDEYTKGVVDLNNTLLDIIEIAKSIDYTEEFGKVEQRIVETNETLINVNETNNTRYEDLLERLSAVTTQMTDAVALMNELSTHNEEIQSDIKLAIARANSIDTKLEALSSQDLAPAYVSNFETELNELKTTVELFGEDQQEEQVADSSNDTEVTE